MFIAYKTSIDGNQNRRDFRSGLTKEECNKLPTGKQSDNVGDYVWQYGIREGNYV